jgi:hypothetical protein
MRISTELWDMGAALVVVSFETGAMVSWVRLWAWRVQCSLGQMGVVSR